MKDIKYVTIVPLVGGMTIGNEMATNKWPEFLLSYSAFNENDSNIVNYLKDKGKETPYHHIDSEGFTLETVQNKNIDFVSAVCPCAGLSMLNSANRGSDAAQNEWMYKSANFVLNNIKPKVFWGENAPGLVTSIGEGVREKLYDIALKYGYSFSIVKTSSMLHGIPQRRIRTFYFFWKSETAPIMNFYERDMPALSEFIKNIPEEALYQENRDNLSDNVFFKWFKENFNRKDIKYSNYTIIKLIEKDRSLLESLKLYIRENGDERDNKKIDHIINKYSQGKGVWDDSPHFYTDVVNAVITKNMRTAVHPEKDRYLNNRELMTLMGLPYDFNLTSNKWSVYTQNVPTFTARDWTYEVIKFINNELPLSDSKYLIQDNLNKTTKNIVPAEQFKTKAIF